VREVCPYRRVEACAPLSLGMQAWGGSSVDTCRKVLLKVFQAPLAPSHSSTLQDIYQHVSQHHQPSLHNFGHWRNQGLFAPWDRVKFPFSTVEESCETNPLLQCTVLQILRHRLFNQISTNE
jgi:hypothetical protein